MSKLRKHDYTLDGSDWDLSLLSLNEAPVEELSRNPKARKIDLSNNSLTELPASFTALTHIVELDLSKNHLTHLPDSFGNLNKLVRLDLYGNQLKKLPISFGQLAKLKWLDLKDNPLDQTLAKYAGDCADGRQCQSCAINCIKFMKSEKLRIESEMRLKEEKLKQKLEIERQLEEKNRKDKQKKKAKNARRSAARKAQHEVDSNQDNGLNETEDSDSNTRSGGHKSEANSLGKALVYWILFLMRFLLSVSFVLLIVFIGISIGLYLQKGHKLESMADIRTALSTSYKSIQNKEFMKETTILFENIIISLKNWRKTFNVFVNKQNVTKT